MGHMTKKKIEINLEESRNTPEQFSWFQNSEDFISNCGWSEVAKQNNFPIFSSRQAITRFIEIYEFYKMARDIPGCFLECGTESGKFLMALAHCCAIFEGYHYTRRIIGFDTFCGFTKPSEQDLSSSALHMKEGGLAFDSYETLKASIKLYDQNRVLGHIPKVELVKGDISKTLPKLLKKDPSLIVGLLHLDVDLYKPTKDILLLLIDRMPKGALIIFDEPNHKDYPGETLAMHEVLGLANLRLKKLETSSTAAYAFIE
jgi:hypothetical protein